MSILIYWGCAGCGHSGISNHPHSLSKFSWAPFLGEETEPTWVNDLPKVKALTGLRLLRPRSGILETPVFCLPYPHVTDGKLEIQGLQTSAQDFTD